MAPAESSGPSKRRKVGGGELEMFQLKNRRQLLENSGNSTASNDQYSSPSSDHVLASCCSSNGSSEVSNEKLNFTDLEQEVNVQIETSTDKFGCRERRETTPLSDLGAQTDELESTVRPSEVNSRRQSTTEKMPTDAQLEEFFDVAEKNLQKQFTDKYNYDIAKDEPLDGRYEWVRLNP